MDFANRDILAHARPYALDRPDRDAATRLGPRYSRVFARTGTGGTESLRVYAEWFRTELASWPERVRSLGENHPLFESRRMEYPGGSGEGGTPGRPKGEEKWFSSWPLAAIPDPVRRGFAALSRALEGREGPGILQELGPLLMPEEAAPSPSALAGELRSLLSRYLDREQGSA
jgi:hypothetical protein